MSLDIISSLPQPIIESILCLLPIEEAVRTSILTTEWRHKWTKIPKLQFSESTVKRPTDETTLSVSDWFKSKLSDFEHARRNKEMWCKLLYAINQVLYLRQGPVHEFTLSMYAENHTCSEIDQIILHLSRYHTVKKLTLDLGVDSLYNIPFSFFWLHHLTDLCLENCMLSHTPLFNGFGSLTSLTLKEVLTTKETLLHLLSNCPSLKSLCLILYEENFEGYGKPSMKELFKCIPMIEHLTTWGEAITFLAQYSVPDELPVSLIHLKYCSIEEMEFDDIDGFTFVFGLIKCAPNLEKIKLQIDSSDRFDLESLTLKECSNIMEEYSDVWLERLNELEIENFRNLKTELEFVKFIMTRSPNLKKVRLLTDIDDKKEELQMTKILLRAPCVSPVEIIVKNPSKRIYYDD